MIWRQCGVEATSALSNRSSADRVRACRWLQGWWWWWGVLFRLWQEDLGGWAPVDVPTCCWYLESCLKKKKKGGRERKKEKWNVTSTALWKYAPRSGSSRSRWLKFLPAKSCRRGDTLPCYCIAARPFLLFRARRQWTAASRPRVVKNIHILKKKSTKKSHLRQAVKRVFVFFFLRENCFQGGRSRQLHRWAVKYLAAIPWAEVSDTLPPPGGSVMAVSNLKNKSVEVKFQNPFDGFCLLNPESSAHIWVDSQKKKGTFCPFLVLM